MKQIIISLLFLAGFSSLYAQLTFTALKLTPAYPAQGQTVSFEYDKSKSTLKDTAAVDIKVYAFGGPGLATLEPAITRHGNLYTGSFTVDPNYNCLAFKISAGGEKDINEDKGYIVPVYTDKNIPVESYYRSAADLQNGYGEYMLGITGNAATGLAVMEDGMKAYPELKTNSYFFDTYLRFINRAKKKEAPALIETELRSFEKKDSLSADDYNLLIEWYARDNRKEKVDSLTKSMQAAFPVEYKKGQLLTAVQKEQDLKKKISLYKELVALDPVSDMNKNLYEMLRSQIATAAAGAKDYKLYKEWNSQVSKQTASGNNNNIAWQMAEGNGDLSMARKLSAEAVAYAKAEMQHPTQRNDATMGASELEKQRKGTYAMYGDTYAFILYKLGDFKTGFIYAKEAASINELKDAQLNERYALLAEKVLPLPQAKKLLEQFTKEGVATPKTKAVLKNLYVKQNKNDKGFKPYLDALEAPAKAKKLEELAKTMLNENSPVFQLQDFEGKAVGLNELKGKVLVVDFWATWCGPCVASMPGMNKALTKYKDNENVKFLFVDTWENSENKLQNAKDFMTKKKYPFYVLMDNDNKMVEDFKVSGIPTKFIIDKEGKIRFKAVGFGGDEDALVDELTAMIDLAGK